MRYGVRNSSSHLREDEPYRVRGHFPQQVSHCLRSSQTRRPICRNPCDGRRLRRNLPIGKCHGVEPVTAEKMNRLGIFSSAAEEAHLPSRHRDWLARDGGPGLAPVRKGQRVWPHGGVEDQICCFQVGDAQPNLCQLKSHQPSFYGQSASNLRTVYPPARRLSFAGELTRRDGPDAHADLVAVAFDEVEYQECWVGHSRLPCPRVERLWPLRSSMTQEQFPMNPRCASVRA